MLLRVRRDGLVIAVPPVRAIAGQALLLSVLGELLAGQ
jgi:hypothetical protein